MLEHYKYKGKSAFQEGLMQKKSNSYGTNTKIPVLNITSHTGDLFKTEDLIKQIKNAFKINGVGNFLTNVHKCDNRKI